MTIPLAIALVVTAVAGLWEAVHRGATEAIRIALGSVGVLLLGATLQLISPLGILIGTAGAAGFLALEIREALQLRRGRFEHALQNAPLHEADLILHDRIDLLETRAPLSRQAASVVALSVLAAIGLTSIFRGLDPASRSWLFLDFVVLLLPLAHGAAALLRSLELKHLATAMSTRPSIRP